MHWSELRDLGVDYNALREMVREGSVYYAAIGVFALHMDYEPLPFTLAVLKTHGTEYFACLTTAAAYHGLLKDPDEYLWMVLPNNRNTLSEVYGYHTVPVRWSKMRLPDELRMTEADRRIFGNIPGMTETSLAELYCGVATERMYGADVKITTPARTVCDLLLFRDKSIGRAGLNGLYIPSSIAFDALREYAMNFDVADAVEFAERMDYGANIVDSLRIAANMASAPRP